MNLEAVQAAKDDAESGASLGEWSPPWVRMAERLLRWVAGHLLLGGWSSVSVSLLYYSTVQGQGTSSVQ